MADVIPSFSHSNILKPTSSISASEQLSKPLSGRQTSGKPDLSNMATNLLSENSASESMNSASGNSASSRPQKKTIEQRYTKKTQLEHILLRPETYIGSTDFHQQNLWVWDEEKQKMIYKNINYVPGLFKIFDEILVNAADAKARETHESTVQIHEKMTCIKVEINKDDGLLSVFNDGDSIPIEIHKEHQVYVPEMIFGQLLTSDNYDDSEERVTGGRNGYGAKLTNIFSSQFIVECGDSQRKRRFRMSWTDNMTKKNKANIKDYTGNSFVKVTFKPDYNKFAMQNLDTDIISLLTKRVYDIAGTAGVKVFLNNKRLQIKDFKSYVDLYFPKNNENEEGLEVPAETTLKVYEKQHRWEIVICSSDGNQFQHVSFVNSISTPKGGTHVSHVVDPLIQSILKKANSKNKGGMEIKSQHVKSHLWIFVNCMIVNPSFDSQTKETLTTKITKFGSKCTLSDKTINTVCKSSIVENVVLWAQTKQQFELKKQMKTGGTRGKDRIIGIPKLEDANLAGGKHSHLCTLILTEGDSAKTSCLAGLSVVGRDTYGIFPLKGKLLNVRDASFNQLKENKEIQNIMKVMGLQVTDKLESPKGLRYGSLMIMTDQDFDGSHIKGLIINFVDNYWPNLLKFDGFLKEFVTPIVKVSKGNQEISFFTIPEYEAWRNSTQNIKQWKIKYYKGLGTSTDREFKTYFSKLNDHQLDFKWDGVHNNEAIDLAFSKRRAEDRKTWMLNHEEGSFVDHKQKTLTYFEFINKELILFSKYDTERSVPSLIDGLKPGQRKVLYSVFKRNLKTECKVVQLAGYVSEHSGYHHGETSLQQTIVNMAQNFCGSNNINFLDPCGQFGSRAEGGKDASAPRYIFTKLNPITRSCFMDADDALLHYRDDDGERIEPYFYSPIIPTVLVNGAEGIGTGWSCYIPNYNVRDIVANVRRYLKGLELEPMHPSYRHFKGTIIPNEKQNGYDSLGLLTKLDDQTVRISELPVKRWTSDYREWLEDNLSKADGKEGLFLDFTDNSSHEDIDFTVKLSREKMLKAEQEGLIKFFRLKTSIPTTNFTLFDEHLKLHKYNTEIDIIKEFINHKIKLYATRKAYILAKLEKDRQILDNRVRFIEAVTSGLIIINNKAKKYLIDELYHKGFSTMSEIQKIFKSKFSELNIKNNISLDDELSEIEENSELKTNDYDYLLGMQLWSLTREKINELNSQFREKEVELINMRGMTVEQMWEQDLDQFIEMFNQMEENDRLIYEEGKKMKNQSKSNSMKTKKQLKSAQNGKKKSKKQESSDDESSIDSCSSSEDDWEKSSSSSFNKNKFKNNKKVLFSSSSTNATPQASLSIDKQLQSYNSIFNINKSNTKSTTEVQNLQKQGISKSQISSAITNDSPIESMSLMERIKLRQNENNTQKTLDSFLKISKSSNSNTSSSDDQPTLVTQQEILPDNITTICTNSNNDKLIPKFQSKSKTKITSNKPTPNKKRKSILEISSEENASEIDDFEVNSPINSPASSAIATTRAKRSRKVVSYIHLSDSEESAYVSPDESHNSDE